MWVFAWPAEYTGSTWTTRAVLTVYPVGSGTTAVRSSVTLGADGVTVTRLTSVGTVATLATSTGSTNSRMFQSASETPAAHPLQEAQNLTVIVPLSAVELGTFQ